MSKHHEAIKNSPEWKAARVECLERDGYACVWCGSEDQLEVDHIEELAENPELATDLDNLRTLCRDCHEKRTAAGNTGRIERYEWINPKYLEVLKEILNTDSLEESA